MKNLWMLLLFLMLTSGCSKTSDIRVWTSGSDTVEAKFVGMTEDGQEVILENMYGEQASIPLTQLSQKDQNWVKKHCLPLKRAMLQERMLLSLNYLSLKRTILPNRVPLPAKRKRSRSRESAIPSAGALRARL